MAVHLLHGCSREWAPGPQIYRNFVPETALRAYLRSAPTRYGASVSPTEPHVLTIDDSTKGAGHAAAIAREYGHHVFLFVNPHQIITGQLYFFSLLNACIDSRRKSQVGYRDVQYDLVYGVTTFRSAARRVLSMLDPQAALEHVAEIGALLSSGPYEIREHAQTLTVDELQRLRDIGVAVENHGWDHRSIDALDASQLADDVAASQAWLLEHLGVRSSRYAVPFGDTRMAPDEMAGLAETVYLANRGPLGRVGKSTWNRIEITRELQSSG